MPAKRTAKKKEIPADVRKKIAKYHKLGDRIKKRRATIKKMVAAKKPAASIKSKRDKVKELIAERKNLRAQLKGYPISRRSKKTKSKSAAAAPAPRAAVMSVTVTTAPQQNPLSTKDRFAAYKQDKKLKALAMSPPKRAPPRPPKTRSITMTIKPTGKGARAKAASIGPPPPLPPLPPAKKVPRRDAKGRFVKS